MHVGLLRITHFLNFIYFASCIRKPGYVIHKDRNLANRSHGPSLQVPSLSRYSPFPSLAERANRQQLPQSPSLPSISNIQNDPFILNSRGNSDVQGKVAQFNSLSKEAAQRRKDNEAALKRAVLGREEAESETRRLREENRVLRQDVEEGRARERRVGERLEGVMVGQPIITDGFLC